MAGSSDSWYTQEFPRIFQASRSGLEAKISATKSATQVEPSLVFELAQEVANLSKSLADAHDKLPTYDQRQYGLHVKALEKMVEELRVVSKPKAKFAFKRTAVATSNTPQSPPAISTDKESSPRSNPKTNNASLSHYSYRYISIVDLATSSNPSDLTISSIDHCIINLASLQGQSDDVIQLSAVHVENLSDSVLILPVVNGSILLHGLTRCILAVGCHQFRMHDSQNVHVYLSIKSSPVIEHCSDIFFTAYPDAFQDQRAILNRQDSRHLSVQDFSHIRATPSPHWSILDNDSIIKSWPTTETPEKEGVLEILLQILPNIIA